ncbi:MAG: DUF1003 domain-containing protein [Saprospiraceae bacterium]|nr:DUF1003 domain-containing protein [Saprospiraceae bacterium]
MPTKEKFFTSDISGRNYLLSDRVTGSAVGQSILTLIRKDYPDFKTANQLSVIELNDYRKRYIETLMSKQIGELSKMEKTVLSSLSDRSTLADKEIEDETMPTSIGQRLADKVASFGGSWKFIILFMTILVVWIFYNVYILKDQGFDPYPFILLNLILSCIAALQAPVIMMSQNRQEEKDRERSKKDYMINLKSELEIRMLHEKLDHLIIHQQQEMLEIQQVQIEMMNDILEKLTAVK